ncbi:MULTISPECIES: DUF5700 domain-containing putative Zn-dependent protease [Chryseobacterium]|uniref:DUF5700 domain-containing putative Zn-dependent protease n=1 Tax=Chryseobacterium TaxID=59732 RepID=UPI001BED233D|nr:MULTISPECIES: DUF5700 domain-containing putative Zn-dependent protease [Chryseobacterium]MBT2622560.1 hypothetical protein [Chryseobacterium sp. ISL-6]
MQKIILALFVFLASQIVSAQTFDDSSCWEYFKLTADLKQDKPLDKKTWDQFLKNEAIQVYLNDQGVDSTYTESYRRSMEIVYMPKNSAILQEKLKKPMSNWWIYNINECKVNEDQMKKYLTDIKKDSKGYFDTCYQYTYNMLPKKYQKKAPNYKVTIIPIHNDAHVENGWIIYTLISAYFHDANKMGAMGGHEFHHLLRPQLVFKTDDQDAVIISLLQKILNEGSADLTDKIYEGKDAIKLLEYQRGTGPEFIADGAKVIKNIDSLLSVKQLDRSKLKMNKLINNGNRNGHIPGFYMSNIIDKGGYKKELIKYIDDPFQFVYLYDKASRKVKDAYILSSTTMDLIHELDKKYRPKATIEQQQLNN